MTQARALFDDRDEIALRELLGLLYHLPGLWHLAAVQRVDGVLTQLEDLARALDELLSELVLLHELAVKLRKVGSVYHGGSHSSGKSPSWRELERCRMAAE